MEKPEKVIQFSVPREIIFQILKEFPVKCLLRLRCVSKLWCSIIDDPFFVQSHHTRSHTRPGGISILRVINKNGNVYNLEFTGPEGGRVHHILNIESLNLGDPQYVNGLVRIDNWIWNPSTREGIAIPPMSMSINSLKVQLPYSSFKCQPEYFFGFDPSTMKYKVLNRCHITTERGNQMKTRIEYKILTLGTNSSWRDIDDSIPHQLDAFVNNGSSCCIADVIYSIYSSDRKSDENHVLVAFELGHEKFRVMPLPQGTNQYSYLVQVRERLAVIDYDVKTIWILEDWYNQLWNKQSLTLMYDGKPLINHNGVTMQPFGTIHTNEILVQLFFYSGSTKLTYYDLESKRLRILKLSSSRRTPWAALCTKHVESLFPLKGFVSCNYKSAQ